MINCVVEKKAQNAICLSVKGHAGYAEHGQDIVCSAVSALVETLIARLLQLNAKFSYKKQSGAVEIEMRKLTYDAKAAFDFAILGLKLIQTVYPKNVELQTADFSVKM